MANPSIAQDTQVLPREQAETGEKRLNEILSSYEGKEEELIPILQQVQQAFGYVPEPIMKKIAKFLQLPESTVFGVGTFYAQFKLVPSGRNIIRVCRGTACHVRGGARILREVEKHLGIKPGESTPDLEYCLETVACIGACGLAPVICIGETFHANLSSKKIPTLLNEYRKRADNDDAPQGA